MNSAQGPRCKLPEVVYHGLWQKWSKDCRFSASACSSVPAAVTRLVFLQVPPYPEVFRDSLHTYKLNEQDTDVRAALLLPLSTQPLPLVLVPELLRRAPRLHVLSHGKDDLLPVPPSPSFLILPTRPCLPCRLCAAPLSSRPLVFSSGTCLLQEHRLCWRSLLVSGHWQEAHGHAQALRVLQGSGDTS